jgi:hypothetical protein
MQYFLEHHHREIEEGEQRAVEVLRAFAVVAGLASTALEHSGNFPFSSQQVQVRVREQV